MTVDEIMSEFDSEWVLIVDPDTNGALQVQSGTVRAHGKDRDQIYREGTDFDDVAFLYTGKPPKDLVFVL